MTSQANVMISPTGYSSPSITNSMSTRKLQKTSHLPPNPGLFRDYAKYGQFQDIR